MPQRSSASDAVGSPPETDVRAPIDALLACIHARDLRVVAAHWCAARGSQMMPAWQMIRPSAMSKQLPIVWAYKYDRQTQRFTVRLAGDRVTQIFGTKRNVRGVSMEDIFPAAIFDRAYKLFSRVVQEPAVYWSSGHVFSHQERHGWGERIILPLSSDGIWADGILGATDYRYHQVNGTSFVRRGAERWFCLRPERTSGRRTELIS
jgi:hypothetical protein